MNKKYLMFFVFLVFVNVSVVGGSSPEKYRERKKTLIKKYMRKVKRPEGIIRLVNGRGPFEGEFLQAINVAKLFIFFHNFRFANLNSFHCVTLQVTTVLLHFISDARVTFIKKFRATKI